MNSNIINVILIKKCYQKGTFVKDATIIAFDLKKLLTLMEQELTMEELIALINSQKGDFVIRVEFGEEAVSDAKEE